MKPWIALITLLLLTSCSMGPKPRVVKFEPASYEDITNWHSDKHAKALKAFVYSCEKFLVQDPNKKVSALTDIGGKVEDWQAPCVEAMFKIDFTDDEARQFFEKWFKPYYVYNENMNPNGTLTGYYEIELEGHTKPTAKYKYPVYRFPQGFEHLKGSSELSHAAINDGAIADKGYEVAWVDNKARLYFMQIQGSGKLKLPNGKELRLGFDGSNGYRFKGIHEELKNRGAKLSSANEMMDYLHQKGEEGIEIMETDPSYVFFRPVESHSAIGGQGVPLTTERSMAVDCGLYPYGMPLWVETRVQKTKYFEERDYNRLFIAQDTGGAIRGAVRGDVFFGTGYGAEVVAGGFKTKGRFFALFPKTVQIPSTYTSR